MQENGDVARGLVSAIYMLHVYMCMCGGRGALFRIIMFYGGGGGGGSPFVLHQNIKPCSLPKQISKS